MRGRALCALGRFEEAEPLALQGRELGDDDDPMTQALWRQVAALVQAHHVEYAEAEELARQAVAITLRSDGLVLQGDALSDLADVLDAAGRQNEAASTLREALDCYEAKCVVPLAHRTRERLAALQARTA
jgi:tetratricopeptide (TPR) repeat protein